MDYSKLKIGVDIDNTLTDMSINFSEIKDLEKTRNIMRSAPVKKGVEILSLLCVNPVVITGRGDYYHADTIYWLNENKIPYDKLITISREKYPEYKFDFDEYINYKVSAYLDNNIQFCLEDDIHVINILSKHGIKCSLVKDDFEEAFYRLFK